MKSIRVANLKSIKDSGEVELKPLTILVGRNNSGKSSFLRLFSLLRQSVEVRTRGPLLWYGQYVDYGSFEEAIRQGEDGILLQFSFNITENMIRNHTFPYYRRFSSQLDNLIGLQVSVAITLMSAPDITKQFVSKVEVKFKTENASSDDVCLLEIDHANNVTRFSVNDLDILRLTEDFEVGSVSKTIPVIISKKALEQSGKTHKYFRYSARYFNDTDPALHKAILKELYQYFRGGTSEATKLNVIRGMSALPIEGFIEKLRTTYSGSKTWDTNLRTFNPKGTGISRIRNLFLATIVPIILIFSDEHIQRMAEKVRSIAPVRATAERYYRKQGLAINEVDYKGQNLAMYLSNLSEKDTTSFRQWTTENFGFEVQVKHQKGHVEILIKEENSSSTFNLADIGFGFSQILPVVAQLWSIAALNFPSSNQGTEPHIFTIEQPELHLHPSFQAKVADMFINAILTAKKHNFDLRLLVETHSEAIVNRIGNQIAGGHLNKDYVNVVIFDKKSPKDCTEVSFARYDDSGYLINWPYGFFQPDEG